MLRKAFAPASTTRGIVVCSTENRSSVKRPLTPATAGLVLLDAQKRVVYHNIEAAKILVFPRQEKKIIEILPLELQAALFRSDWRGIATSPSADFRSGRRRYGCRLFILGRTAKALEATTALLLERTTPGSQGLSSVARQFGLTLREQETVELLTLGLTSKEIASRMNISPNTVKAFFRMVMTKMAVSTRAGIVGKISRMLPSE